MDGIFHYHRLVLAFDSLVSGGFKLMFGFFRKKPLVEPECNHDWIRFRTPKCEQIKGNSKEITSGIFYPWGWYWIYENQIVMRARGYTSRLPRNEEEICDLTCSLCNTMDLQMQRAITITRRGVISAANCETEWRRKEEEINIRRNAARKFALNYIKMKDKAGSS